MFLEIFRYLFKMILIYTCTSCFVYFLYVNNEMIEISALLVFIMSSVIQHYVFYIDDDAIARKNNYKTKYDLTRKD
ncbi:MAG: hypothetical protein ACERKK_07830 [Poseidonibacter sp.]|uniref:hypothetical protein n=1 Tax=Poseidonibacter sp. TaxID=2321188 RepID=UPI00359DEB43